jgi:putative transcriptional regulator
VSMCDECRARLYAFEAVGGALIEETEVADMSSGSLAATLARISMDPAQPKPVPRRTNGVFPAPLQDYTGCDLEDIKWRRVGGGVSDFLLKTSRGSTVRLLRIPSGVAVPDHGHRGMELTLVLKGAFRDETDRFAAGDVEVADADMVHKPVAEQGEDCICLAATDAPLRFNAFIPRMAQSFLRI